MRVASQGRQRETRLTAPAVGTPRMTRRGLGNLDPSRRTIPISLPEKDRRLTIKLQENKLQSPIMDAFHLVYKGQ